MKNFFRNFFTDLKKVRWNKTKPTLKILAITLVIVALAATFVFLVTWGITATLDLMKG